MAVSSLTGCAPEEAAPPEVVAPDLPLEPLGEPMAPTGPQPKAVVDEPDFEFGRIATGETGSHTFVIRNEGEAPLTVELGPTTCKCTVGELNGNHVEPGGEVEVELSWTVAEEHESFRQEALVRTNDPKNENLKLSIRGKVVFPLAISPGGIWNLPEIEDETPIEWTGRIKSVLFDEFEILSIDSASEFLTASTEPLTAEELQESEAKSGYAVHLRLTPEFPGKSFAAKLNVKTSLPGFENMEIPVSAGRVENIMVFGPLWNVQGNFLSLGMFEASQGKKASVTLFLRNAPDNLKFSDPEADPEALSVTLDRLPDVSESSTRKRYRVTFEIPPGAPPTSRDRLNRAIIRVKTNHPHIPTIKFGVQYRSI